MATPASTDPAHTGPATSGVALLPGAGRRITGGGLDATVKVGSDRRPFASMFDVAVPPGYDVGAHVHHHGEEVFYILEGRLDVLAFEPVDRTVADWHAWEAADGQRYLSGGPGAFLYVPAGVPHAFANTSDTTTRVFFQSSAPGGHDNYFDELAEILRAGGGAPDLAAVAELRRRYDIEQLTSLRDRA